MILQIEFKIRQASTRFAKYISKAMPQYFVSKGNGCVMLDMGNEYTRNKVRDIIIKKVPKCEIRYRDSGVDYLYVK